MPHPEKARQTEATLRTQTGEPDAIETPVSDELRAERARSAAMNCVLVLKRWCIGSDAECVGKFNRLFVENERDGLETSFVAGYGIQALLVEALDDCRRRGLRSIRGASDLLACLPASPVAEEISPWSKNFHELALHLLDDLHSSIYCVDSNCHLTNFKDLWSFQESSYAIFFRNEWRYRNLNFELVEAKICDEHLFVWRRIRASSTSVTGSLNSENVEPSRPTPRRERGNLDDVEREVLEIYDSLWKVGNASEWGRRIGERLKRKSPVDRRTIKRLPSWIKAEKRRADCDKIRKRLRGVRGLSKPLQDSLADPSTFEIDDVISKLDDADRRLIKASPELLELLEEQVRESRSSR